jgi:hypothetical protein
MQTCGLGGAFICGTSIMPLLPLLVRISLLIAGAFPILYISTASGEDVQAYCANVGDDDGVKTIPAGLVAQARKLFFQPSAAVSDVEVRDTTSFRCMSGKIWLCNYGANLVCGKANRLVQQPFVRKTQAQTACPWLPRVMIRSTAGNAWAIRRASLGRL